MPLLQQLLPSALLQVFEQPAEALASPSFEQAAEVLASDFEQHDFAGASLLTVVFSVAALAEVTF